MKNFPMLGFAEEKMLRPEHPYYACRPAPAHPRIVITVWRARVGEPFTVAMHQLLGRYSPFNNRSIGEGRQVHFIKVDDPLEAQCIIYHMLQHHLPSEVTA